MSDRRTTGRHVLTGKLVAELAVHVGAADSGDFVDQPFVRDGLDRPVVPGTSLAGALSAALKRCGVLDDSVLGLFGPEHGARAATKTEGASFVLVDDAPADDPCLTQVRDHVSVDRIHATAAPGRLFTQEVVPAGTRFACTISVEIPTGEDQEAKTLFTHVVDLLRISGLSLGGSQSRGLGRVRLAEGATTRIEDHASSNGVLEALKGCTETPVTVPANAAPDPWSVRIVMPWRPLGAVMVGQQAAIGEISQIPLAEPAPNGEDRIEPGHDDDLRLLLPGSSIKGALGAYVERAARTLSPIRPVTPALIDDQIGERKTLPGLDALLGTPAEWMNDAMLGGSGALACADCTSVTAITRADWDHFVSGQGTPAALILATHVAIDRWTGGAAPNLLFTVAEPQRGATWKPMVFDVDASALADDRVAWGLLLSGLRAMTRGEVPLGSQTTRGIGSIAVDPDRVTFEAGSAVPEGSVGHRLGGRTLAEALADGALTTELDDALEAAYPLQEAR